MIGIWINSETLFYKPGVGNLWQEQLRGQLFDSYLGTSSHYTQNHVLRLLLRVFLNPINKRTHAKDANKHSFPIRDWTDRGWNQFKEQFAKQSRLWNDRFWLVPPRHFSLKDVRSDRNYIRPNIMCFLDTELTDSPGRAHAKIDVFNIDVDEVKRRDEIDDNNPMLGKFRSSSHRLDSTDVKTGMRTYEDADGNEYTVKNHYTIAHEIGHVIGQPHIGILKGTKKCAMAMKFKKDKVKPDSFIYRGGGNAKVCYGEYDDASGIAENIMGLGYKFDVVNAAPWTERLALHTNTMPTEWHVSLGRLTPQTISEKDHRVSDSSKWVAM